jgi:AraC-like DNA-binding protein
MLKFDVLATATAYAPSLREALACVLRFQALLFEQAELTLVERGDSLFLRSSPVASSELATRVRSELAISCPVRLMRHVGAPEAAVLRVAFVHREPHYAREYAPFLGERVFFEQPESGIEIDVSWLDRRVRHANVELHRLLTAQAQQVLTRVHSRDGYGSQLRDYLCREFPRVPEMREAARALAVSERSLRRRLAEEGGSYSTILHETRLVIAQRLLCDPTRSISQVAVAVGFADGPAFFRAFKRWTGRSPSAYRSAQLCDPDAIADEKHACHAH